ncbi:hypothetical protein [Salicibibacter halophilus]|nr:hypothetical protein [Salicibibacter halophilus]
MMPLTRAEMARLLVELCGIPKVFLEKMDEDDVRQLFDERLGPLKKEA